MIVSLVACAPSQNEPTLDIEEGAPRFAFVTDSVTRVAGLPVLRRMSVTNDYSEIRIWTGFGVIIPEQLLRIVETPGSVTGELYYWWTVRPDSQSLRSLEAPSRFTDDMKRQSGNFGCTNSAVPDPARTPNVATSYNVASEWVVVCRVDFGDHEPEWHSILDRIRGHHAFTLAEPPPQNGGHDGLSIQVEVLEPIGYRTYTYFNPHAQQYPDAAFADSLIQVVVSVRPRF